MFANLKKKKINGQWTHQYFEVNLCNTPYLCIELEVNQRSASLECGALPVSADLLQHGYGRTLPATARTVLALLERIPQETYFKTMLNKI